MTRIDQFQSMFRSASREIFRYERPVLQQVLMISDLAADALRPFSERVQAFLDAVIHPEAVWRDLEGAETRDPEALLAAIREASPDLICTYRNLHSQAWQSPYSLGTHLDLIVQRAGVPVLVLPHPAAQREAPHALQNTDRVMAMTDHLDGDAALVNYAVRFAEPGGTLWLTHIEDQQTFDRYLNAISKIDTIDTDTARTQLREQLLKDPAAFIQSCRTVLRDAGVDCTVEPIVTFGHHLAEYKRLIADHQIDVLVLHTQDEDQLAMHGIAYELTVEVRNIPLLLLG